MSGVLHEASVTLAPDAISARMARTFLADLLSSSGEERWLEPAQLALSEVVTNGVLHAHTDLVVTALVHADHLRVEVHDSSPQMPVQRTGHEGPGEDATTGRGMRLVAALTAECGVHPVAPVGKVVWFVVRDTDELGEDDLLAAWDLDELLDAPPAGEQEPHTTVVLRGLPPTLYLAARDRHIAMLRELVLHAAEHPDAEPVDSELAERARVWVSTAVTAALDEARAAGLARRPLPPSHPAVLPDVPPVLDVPVRLPHDGQAAVLALQELLDVGERLAWADRLLLRPGLPEIVALRDWICDSLIAGLGGVDAGPWGGVDQERFTEFTDPPAAAVAWDSSVVTDATRGAVAVDDTNRIVAVSTPMAAMVGWDTDDLVGRRVLTLIPPALREAHVAGFTRHLTTGRAELLGVPLQLPVLHRDGHEVACEFLIERAPSSGDRRIYLAWITPAG